MTTYRTAIYCRKSSEDEDSIQIQEDFVKGYIADKREFELHKTYADNGYTGVNFDRPAWKEMMRDIKYGIVQCIIVKDLSRLGRNYIEVNEYLERTFPTKGIRVIAITDRYDSLNASGLEIETAFMNLLNSHMAAETSYKIHQTLDGKMNRGEVVSRVPYGYVRSGETMEINPEKAEVVRKIYNWFIEGVFISDIIRNLYEEKIPSPAGAEKWNDRTIKRILQDKTYIGDYEPGKRRQELYKPVEVNADEGRHFTKHHEPIISENVFGVVQYALEIRSNRWKESKASEEDPDVLKGLTRCALCKGALSYLRKNSKTRVMTSKYYCKRHTGSDPVGVPLKKRPEITADEMKAEVVRQYNEYIDRAAEKDSPQQKKALELTAGEMKEDIAICERMISQRKKELISIYEQYVEGVITPDEFSEQKAVIREKINNLEALIKDYKARILKQDVSKAMRKEILTLNDKLSAFEEETIRRVVEEVVLNADGKVQVKFKLDPAVEVTK